MYSILHPDQVFDIALQPGTDGNVFASACEDGIVRLFDIRQSVTGILLNILHCNDYIIPLNICQNSYLQN